MLWNRRWVLIGILALGQVAIIACYHSLLGGSTTPAPQAALPSSPVADPLVAPRWDPPTVSPGPTAPVQQLAQVPAPADVVPLPPPPPRAPTVTESFAAPPAAPRGSPPPRMATNAPVDVPPPFPATEKAMIPPPPALGVARGEEIQTAGPPAPPANSPS